MAGLAVERVGAPTAGRFGGVLLSRQATENDIDPLVALVTSAYRGDASREGWTTEAHLLEGQRIDADLLTADLDNPHGLVLVWVDQEATGEGAADAIVACCNLVRKHDGVAYFGMFAVSPGRQGAGLGKQILAEAERVAREEWSASALEITVLEPRSELLAFYDRRGFTATGSFVPFPYGDPRFGEPLRDDLRMVVMRKAL